MSYTAIDNIRHHRLVESNHRKRRANTEAIKGCPLERFLTEHARTLNLTTGHRGGPRPILPKAVRDVMATRRYTQAQLLDALYRLVEVERAA